MRRKSKNATMKDVAREAGVALGTVSKVVNGQPVGEEYQKKVEDAIVKLNYQINTYAQGLKSNRTYVVAVLVPNVINPYFASITNALCRSLSKRRYSMLLCCTDFDPVMEQEYVSLASQKKVDGIIGMTYSRSLRVDEDIPFITIDRTMGPGIPVIASDNFAGGHLAAEILADLGCRRVAFLRVGSDLDNEPNKRKAGFENGCLARDLVLEEKIIGDEEHPISYFTDFLSSHKTEEGFTLDGIFCVTDILALQVIEYLRSIDVRVPEDCQVIGFDGLIDYFEKPFCSSIVQPVDDIAEMCTDILLTERTSVKPPLICLPVTYRPGGTTKDSLPRDGKAE